MNTVDLVTPHKDYLIGLRRWFHQHPEPSNQEVNSSARVAQELRSMGYTVVRCGSTTGLYADLVGAKPGPMIMLRADMDALSVPDETGVDYASQNPGISHACGHDCHMSMLVTAAKVLMGLKDQLAGTVRFCFQPAEEIAFGAKDMIEHGVLEGVEAVFSQHVWSEVESGKIAVQAGPFMASGDHFEIKITGKSGHGATPHLCADASVMAANVVMALQTMVSREINPLDTAVITVGVIESGTRFNVVSGRARLDGTARSFNPKVRERYPEQLTRIAQGVCAAYGGTARVQFDFLCPPTVNDAKMAAVATEAAKKVAGDNGVVVVRPTMGAEDFAFYMEKVPGCMSFLGIRNRACNACYAQHHTQYNVDEDALVTGVAYHVQTVLDYFANAAK